ncbi:MAG: hypothetical protein HYZ42_04475 [Bacteroidetes bacterium]|nr:hypothetical protein [Bacteroidota bacterium]
METNDIGQYPYRIDMFEDLIKHHQLKGLSIKQLTNLIGPFEKNYKENDYEIIYPLLIEYSSDIDPSNSLSLIFKLDKDSIVTQCQIFEYKK